MRMSCNGCRVLRKGCSENCPIRPCLQWIKTSESQANATVFLAKFYGRAGLINLLNAAGPQHLRPAIFRSLLYEACGRIVNPIYGSVGLLWSGNWQLCQAAVEAVLKGAPITQITSEAAVNTQGPPLKPYDIRHVSKDETSSPDLHKVIKTRCRFKKSAVKPLLNPVQVDFNWKRSGDVECNRSTSHDSSVSHPQEAPTDSMESGETAEAEPETSAHKPSESPVEDDGLGLELTLGIEPVSRVGHVKKHNIAPSYGDKCKLEMKLE